MSEEKDKKETEQGAATSRDGAPVKAAPARLRQAIALLTSHPLGVVVAVGAAVALVEVELAVGILTGVGATALLATKNGPEARQEVRTLGQEVFIKGKAALERARVALASRTKQLKDAAAAAAAAAPATASAEAAAPKAEEPPAAAS